MVNCDKFQRNLSIKVRNIYVHRREKNYEIKVPSLRLEHIKTLFLFDLYCSYM